MRHYQRTKNNPYILPHNLYVRMFYTVRDYERLIADRDDAIYNAPSYDSQPKGNGTGDPTYKAMLRIDKISDTIHAIEQSLFSIPEEYRSHVYYHITHGVKYPDYADRKTWFSYQAKFLYRLAEKLGEI